MRINFIVNKVEWSPWDTRIGGSEEMVVETAKRLAKNNFVTVYHDGRHGLKDGVEYRGYGEFKEADIVINLNYPEFRCATPQILWTSLTQHPGLDHFSAVCAISEYAQNNTNIQHSNVYIVPPGYDSDRVKRGDKIPKQCLYASSPDRGLEVLMSFWPEVYKAHPDATLVITYGGTGGLPGVMAMGDVDEDMMDSLYATSDIWVHPCTGVELYCMTGVKAQVAGCWPVVIPHMALEETVRFGTKSTLMGFTKDLIAALNGHPEPPTLNYPDWEDTTAKLLKVIELTIGSQYTK